MAKLFVFAVGGSGSRVIKALTMLLASGVSLKNTDVIVPIIIDPDSANGDLTRTDEILKLYRHIHEKGSSDQSSFFRTNISSLDSLVTGTNRDNFIGEVEGVKEHRFKDFIGFADMDKNNQALTALLFSKPNLEAYMDVGFKGNPNIGSVVLNKFRETDCFRKFSQSFAENDRIFIVSSIFGGTGASGFPIILKNIRTAEPPISNHVSLNNARIGAISILPYFSVNDLNDKTTIDSNTFITKTKAALNYYSKNITGNQSVNAMYYIGDTPTDNRIAGADGALDQKNNAHFIELASALAIVDFMELPDDDLETRNGRAVSPRYFEFGLDHTTSSISFRDLAKNTHQQVAKPLTRFTLFHLFLKNHFATEQDHRYATNGNNKLQTGSIDSRFLQDLERFSHYYEEWLIEMRRSHVSFDAFQLDVEGKDILNLVKNCSENSQGLLGGIFKAKGLEYYISALNKAEQDKRFDALSDPGKKLFGVFEKATDNIIQDRIKL